MRMRKLSAKQAFVVVLLSFIVGLGAAFYVDYNAKEQTARLAAVNPAATIKVKSKKAVRNRPAPPESRIEVRGKVDRGVIAPQR